MGRGRPRSAPTESERLLEQQLGRPLTNDERRNARKRERRAAAKRPGVIIMKKRPTPFQDEEARRILARVIIEPEILSAAARGETKEAVIARYANDVTMWGRKVTPQYVRRFLKEYAR